MEGQLGVFGEGGLDAQKEQIRRWLLASIGLAEQAAGTRLTHAEIARRSGISRPTISGIANARQLADAATLERLAEVLGVEAPKVGLRYPANPGKGRGAGEVPQRLRDVSAILLEIAEELEAGTRDPHLPGLAKDAATALGAIEEDRRSRDADGKAG